MKIDKELHDLADMAGKLADEIELTRRLRVRDSVHFSGEQLGQLAMTVREVAAAVVSCAEAADTFTTGDRVRVSYKDGSGSEGTWIEGPALMAEDGTLKTEHLSAHARLELVEPAVPALAWE